MSGPAQVSLQQHWPVPLAVHRFERAAEVNPLLARVFSAIRATDADAPPGHFYASPDDLLRRIDLPEFHELVRFIAHAIQTTAQQANAGLWPPGRHDLQLELMGVWFQVQNGATFHDVHTHGNCSWSGVYYVQIDPPEQRQAHPDFGALNGATRFYSPMFPLLGGAHIDMGNAYLQHKAMPYVGERDRVIISFNAQIRAPGGDQLFRYAGA
jgi:hypothetical protein